MQECNSNKSLGSLRLMYVGSLDLSGSFNRNEMYSLGRSANARSIYHHIRSPRLPFSRQLYRLLCDRFHFAKATSGMLINDMTTSSTPHFQIHPSVTVEVVESTKGPKDISDIISEHAVVCLFFSEKLILSKSQGLR